MIIKETTYSKIVRLKKKLIKRQIVPASIAPAVDNFFNSLHNAALQSRDKTRDFLVHSRDLTRDAVTSSRARAADIAKVSENIAEESFRAAKKETSSVAWRKFSFPFIFAWNLALLAAESIALLSWNISEESDKEAVADLQTIAANSENVRERIRRYYGRDSRVIHPPIETERLKNGKDRGYWLSVNRLTPEKRIGMQTEAFRLMPGEKLVIVGGFDDSQREYAEKIRRDAPSNVRFAGTVEDSELMSLYSHCRGLITTSLDEDFGMNAVEAMAAGKPVIAPDEGGYKETVLDGKTGILLEKISPEKIQEAIGAVNAKLAKDKNAYREACAERAREFGTAHFASGIRNLMSESFYHDPRKQIIFIVGVPRSGTTWLWGLFTSHPDAEPIIKSDFAGIKAARKDGKYESVETNMLSEKTLDEIRTVLDKKTSKFIVEKTPDHLLHIKKIRERFPGAKIVHVMRNPLGVYASYKNSDWNKKVSDVGEWLPLYLRRVNAFLPHQNDKKILTVSYENLHEDTEKTLKKIFRFAGLSEQADMSAIIRENKGVSKAIGNHSIRKAETDSWKEELDEKEIEAICENLESIGFVRKYLRIPMRYRLKAFVRKLKRFFERKNLIFIAGIPRSGTTWLWTLLSNHKDADTLTEYDFKKSVPGKNDYLLKETNMLFDVPIWTIRKVVSKKSKKNIIEKTPLHITKLDFIEKEFPHAKIVHVVRNPFSIYASYKFTEYGGWEHKNIEVERWVKGYKETFSTFADKLDNEMMMTVSYEGLLEDTRGTLERIYAFLGLDPYNIDQTIRNHSYEKMLPKISKLRKPDSLAERLTPTEIEYIKANLKDEIAVLEKMGIYCKEFFR